MKIIIALILATGILGAQPQQKPAHHRGIVRHAISNPLTRPIGRGVRAVAKGFRWVIY